MKISLRESAGIVRLEVGRVLRFSLPAAVAKIQNPKDPKDRNDCGRNHQRSQKRGACVDHVLSLTKPPAAVSTSGVGFALTILGVATPPHSRHKGKRPCLKDSFVNPRTARYNTPQSRS
jgi:hypothetical protein